VADLTGMAVVARAYLAAWRAHGRDTWARLARSRHVLTSAFLVLAGLAGALGGGALIGRWCLGLVLLAESAGAVWFGLMRDDGTGLPRHGERTPLEAAREHVRGLP
jgi:hypothetical protein